MNSQKVTFSHQGYHLIRVLIQEKHKAPFKVARDFPVLSKPFLLWIFETGFIKSLPWDPREWH